ncbi:hypothetical protein pb186bvf_019206 [Paramecium bursaria]
MSKKEVWVDYEEISSIPQRRAAPKKQDKTQNLKNTKNQKAENQNIPKVPQKLESDIFENQMKNEDTQVVYGNNVQNTKQNNVDDDYDDLISRRDDYEQSNMDSDEARERRRYQRDIESFYPDKGKIQQEEDSQSDDEIDIQREQRKDQIRQLRDLGQFKQDNFVELRKSNQFQEQNTRINQRQDLQQRKEKRINQIQQEQVKQQRIKQKPKIVLELEQALRLLSIDKIADCIHRLNKSFALQEQIQELHRDLIFESIMLLTKSFEYLSKYEKQKSLIKEMWSLSVITSNFYQFLAQASIEFYQTFFQSTIQFIQITGDTTGILVEKVIEYYQAFREKKRDWQDYQTNELFSKVLNFITTKPYLRYVEGKFQID